MQPNIRLERQGDELAIRDVTVRAFATADHSDGNEHLIVDALRRRGELAVSVVADHEGHIIGHASASPINFPGWYGLAPVSVLPEFQGQGVGKLLVRAVLAELEQAAGCVVLGDPAYYSKFGFAQDLALTLAGVPAEFFQVLLIKGPAVSGVVEFSEAFTF